MKIVKIGDQMYIEKLMVKESVSPSDYGMYKLASQLKKVGHARKLVNLYNNGERVRACVCVCVRY